MGDGNNVFRAGRGNHDAPPANRGRGRNIWQRDEAAQTSSNNLCSSVSQHSRDRWEIATRELEQRRQEACSLASGGNSVVGLRVGAIPPAVASDPPCLNSNIRGHYTAHCPTIRCERCKRLGHISQICQTMLPWKCVPSMCGFQALGRGFFYMPDKSSAKQHKERASSVVITVIEGDASSMELEHEFNIAFGDSWRCTARTIAPNQYIMRFPTSREVERVVYYGSSMRLKTMEATVRLTTWTASVGAKAALQKAWVKINNIPLDKRIEENAFYAGSLVGISLDLDTSMLHKPEYVKVLIGCKDVELIPESAEGCLGDNFYDFYYEIDKVVVGGPPKSNTTVMVGNNSGAPSPKRARFEKSNTVTEDSSENQGVGSQTDSVRLGRQCGNVEVTEATARSDTPESDEDDSAGGNELLIETMVREHEASKNVGMLIPSNNWIVPYPSLQNVSVAPSTAVQVSPVVIPYSHALFADAWPPLCR
ncbi:hypothetical protein ACQ4PT_004079 [Festuca glaucescens]